VWLESKRTAFFDTTGAPGLDFQARPDDDATV
jgi:hypothetical protein